jgi:lysophospholipase L1-like esterase
MSNLLTATVTRAGVAPLATPTEMSFPVDAIKIEASGSGSEITFKGKKYLVQETVAELVAAAGGTLVQFTVSGKGGRHFSPLQMAFPIESCSVEDISDSLVATLSYAGDTYTATGQDGAPFTGTAAELRDKLAGEVFSSETAADNDNIKLLKELARRARWDNPRTRPVASDQPTITTGTTIPTGLTNAYRVSTHAGLFTFYGGREKTFATTFKRLPSVTLNAGTTGGNAGDADNQVAARIACTVDAAKFSLRIVGSTNPYRVMVDGYYISLTGPVPGSTATPNYITLDYTGTTGRKPRHVIIEMDQSQAFDGIHVGTTDMVYKCATTPFRLIALGDSFLDGSGATVKNDCLGRVMGDLLGVQDTWCSGSGGTGYIYDINDTRYTFRERLAVDVIPYSPHVFATMGGGNDVNSAALQVEVDLYLRQFRAACPGVPHFVFGVWPGNSGPSAANIAKEGYIKAAVEAYGDPLTFFIPVCTDTNGSWMSGTGKTTAPTGTGNGDVYNSSDGTHPNTEGHKYLGMRAADAIINTINALS